MRLLYYLIIREKNGVFLYILFILRYENFGWWRVIKILDSKIMEKGIFIFKKKNFNCILFFEYVI